MFLQSDQPVSFRTLVTTKDRNTSLMVLVANSAALLELPKEHLESTAISHSFPFIIIERNVTDSLLLFEIFILTMAHKPIRKVN